MCARSAPCVFSTDAIDSSHSRVSTGSRSSSFGGSVMDHRKRGRAPVVLARDRMSNDGEQQQVKQVSGRASGTRAGMLLPSARAPAIVSARRGAHRLDALLAIVPPRATAASFRELPESGRWRELNARAPARAGPVRSTPLSNPRQTPPGLGVLADEARAFDPPPPPRPM